MFRIQKILLAEYQELYEPVLVECPFAEVTQDGVGIRQVQIGLTPTRILIGQDVFDKSLTYHMSNISMLEKDPEIECFELVSVIPLEVLKVTFFKKRQRVIMNLNILEEKTTFFEFGGYLSQNLFWNTWRERIATLRLRGTNLFNITQASPFSSSDVIPDEELVTATIHPTPRSYQSADFPSYLYPLPEINAFYKQLPTDIIEKASENLPPDLHHQMELQNYFNSLSVTNNFSCGCSTSW